MDRETPDWRKASYSNGQGACVEVGRAAGGVLVRDTKDERRGPVLAFGPDEWLRFTRRLRSE